MLPRAGRLTSSLSRQLPVAPRLAQSATSAAALLSRQPTTTSPIVPKRQSHHNSKMPISKACCSIPPAQATGYVAKGEYQTINGLKTYVTGSPDATKAILLVYDIFGFYPQTIQGADFLANCNYRVFIPDFFQGEPAELAWFPPDNKEKEAKLAEFFKTKATPSEHTARVPAILAEANKLAPGSSGFAAWGLLGFCWGGKISALLAGANSPFKVAVQAHPAMLDPEDAKSITIPFATLASKDEDAEAVKAFDANLKVPKFTETYADQIHGWMAARSNLSDARVKEEYERGYKTACGFICEHMSADKSKI